MLLLLSLLLLLTLFFIDADHVDLCIIWNCCCCVWIIAYFSVIYSTRIVYDVAVVDVTAVAAAGVVFFVDAVTMGIAAAAADVVVAIMEPREQVRTVVEEHRLRLGFTREQVLFSTDLYGSTSGTYRAEVGFLVGYYKLLKLGLR